MFKLKKNDMFMEVFLPDGVTLVTDRFIFNPIYSIKEYERCFKILFGSFFLDNSNMDASKFQEIWNDRERGWQLKWRLENEYIQNAMETFSKLEIFKYLPSKPKLKDGYRDYSFTSKGLEFFIYKYTDQSGYITVYSYNRKKAHENYDRIMQLTKEINILRRHGLTPQTFLLYFCGKDIKEDYK